MPGEFTEPKEMPPNIIETADTIERKKELLEQKGIVAFEVNLTLEEKESREMQIENPKEFDYFGPANE